MNIDARRGTRRTLTLLLVLAASAVALLAPATAARADGVAGADVQVAQTLGERELTVILRRVAGIPGPLHVDVLTHTGSPPGELRLAVAPAGAASDVDVGARVGVPGAATTVRLGAAAGSHPAVLTVDRAGPWELWLDDGTRRARIPFEVPRLVSSPAERTVYLGFVAAGVLLAVTLAVAVRARNGGWVFLPAGGIVAACAAAVTAALLSASMPEPVAHADPTVDGANDPYAVLRADSAHESRPPVQLTMSGTPARSGEPVTVRFGLTDGGTGLPADDVLVHDAALMHLLVVGPAGRLWHLHPVMTGPGAFEVLFTAPYAGHYAVSAELSRRGGGLQLIRSPRGFTVDGTPPPAGPAAPGDAGSPVVASGSRVAGAAGAVPVRLSTPDRLVAGAPALLTARVGDTATLQPWLGMVGHMIVVGPLDADRPDTGAATQEAEVWAHSHSMGAMSHDSHARTMSGLMPRAGDSPADETVAAYGPDVSFVYAFPSPGTYRVWIQAERDFTVLTAGYLLTVTGDGR
ncbi:MULTISPECIES: hypothetical protein [Catenuloplanes]|uniref:Secreted protein n=1 Tax=Catenuloplanes niger TaxID=587534 RepID=A0AAE3ZKA9_9ACTN|nr:hypothetical protein [Catenuloplanes niger]MDR7320271.1 hypothetical protein [Catenuloplanes niger]